MILYNSAPRPNGIPMIPENDNPIGAQFIISNNDAVDAAALEDATVSSCNHNSHFGYVIILV